MLYEILTDWKKIMKRKILFLVILIGFSMGLSSCIKEMTYDDLLLEYQQDIESRQDTYQNYVDIYDHLSNITMQSVVKITNQISFSAFSSIGSGFVFFEDTESYYVLTNHHVVYNDTIKTATITVTDYLGRDHVASLLALDNTYDLAVLSFPKFNFDIEVFTFSESTLLFEDNVFVMGYPNGQINAMTTGQLIDYDSIIVSNDADEIGVTFEVFIMDVPVETGSSGSVVIDSNYEVVGIIYAGNFLNSNETSEFSFAVPNVKIFEFFDLYDITYEQEVVS
jgi:S1-C subfamily serine protease